MSDRLLKESDVIKAAESLLISHEDRWLNDLEYGNNQALCHMIDRIEELPSADRPQGDSVSRRYLLAEIDDLADEFSEVDENGLHSERWCGISDAKCVILNAPSVPDRPQGEWVDNGDRYFRCSLCGAKDTDTWRWCHGCGVRMRPRLQGKHFDSIIIDESAMKGAGDENA